MLEMNNESPLKYTSTAFMQIVEDHLDELRSTALSGTKLISIQPGLAFKFQGCFSQMLRELGIPAKLHAVTMRVNNFKAGDKFPTDLEILLVPQEQYVDTLAASVKTNSVVT